MENDVKVSVFCTVYNHEKYLRQCLEGFVIQKTNFRFEVLVHDDASTDNSADIIREYETKYPEIIIPIYQKENQHSQGISIARNFLYPRARGKYIASCEGDDYWCDENKLQKQYDALEGNPNCDFCVCKVKDISESGEAIGYYHPNFFINSGVISGERFIELTEFWAFQTSSYFRRKDETLIQNLPRFFSVTDVGDTPLMLYYGQKSDVFYIDKVMSCYRHGAPDSFNVKRNQWSVEKKIIHYNKQIEMYKEFNEYTQKRYNQFCLNEIIRYEYKIDEVQGNYKKLLLKKYKNVHKKMSKKEYLYIFLNAYFPFLINLYEKKKRENSVR